MNSNEQVDISIIVCTYNSDYECLLNTLFSIVIQKDISYEIIIADDGSDNCFKEEIECFFSENNFSKYKLAFLEENKGTVKNLINALDFCEGRFIKSISPGDYLYDSYVLRDWVSFMKKTNCEFSFGRYVSYSANAKEYDKILSSVKRGFRPLDLSIYYPVNNKKKIRYRYLLLDDYPVGSAIIYTKKFMDNYMRMIDGVVKYAEDSCFRIAVSDGIYPRFFDRFTIWYSYGDGISTNKNYKWWKIVFDDIYRAGILIKEKIEINDWFNIRFKIFLTLSKFILTKVVSKYILFPSLLILRLQRDKCENNTSYDEKYLRQILLRKVE